MPRHPTPVISSMFLICFLPWPFLPDLLAQLTNKCWASMACAAGCGDRGIIFTFDVPCRSWHSCVSISCQFHESTLNIISGYCKGGGQWEGASAIQPRQMVGKQISWEISTGNSPFFRGQICPPLFNLLHSCTTQGVKTQSRQMDSDLGIIVPNLISDYSFPTVSPYWGFESKPRKGAWSEAEIQCLPLGMLKQCRHPEQPPRTERLLCARHFAPFTCFHDPLAL